METNSFKRSLSLLDGVLLVVGSMIGSGIFIVSTDIVQHIGSAAWLLVVWLLSGFITLAAALSYGELSGMYPKAGGQYVYLREAYGKLFGFLYGWSFFAVIQTGTIAAVGVAFAKFAAYMWPSLGEQHVLLSFGTFSIKASQLVAIVLIFLLTFINAQGVNGSKWIQSIFTLAKIAAIVLLVVCGLWAGHTVWQMNWQHAWTAFSIADTTSQISHELLQGKTLILAIGTAMVGALFSSDAWNNVTFIAAEIKKPERNIGLSLLIGTVLVTFLYLSMNIMYLNVLSIQEIAHAPDQRVALAAAMKIFGSAGTTIIAVMIMISTFGCNNGLILSGARVYYTMAQDGMFLKAAQQLNKKGVPEKALWMQAIWASLLCLSGKYGDLLDFIIFTVLLFYILTIAGIFILRKKQPHLERPYKAFGYPLIPFVYLLLASSICIILLITKTTFAGGGLLIVLLGLPIYYFIQKKHS